MGKGWEEGKYIVFPLGKNEILVRFENLHDNFDKVSNESSIFVDLNKFAYEFYLESNG